MAHIDSEYNKLCLKILADGFWYADKSRANMLMIQIPTYNFEIDMDQGFPLITTKKIFWRSVAHELIWFLRGDDNIDYLQKNGVRIWNQDAENFSGGSYVGRIYGPQWRSWSASKDSGMLSIDQIKNLIHGLKTDLYNRRHIVTAWNPAELSQMALPPCHWSFEVIPMGFKNFALKWHQRSVDTFLGLPFDIASYAMLGQIIAKLTGLKFKKLIGDLSNIHFYEPHIKLVKKQLDRSPIDQKTEFDICVGSGIQDLHIDNFNINNYSFSPAIKAKMYAKIKL
tara:strand:+ start:1781 stop:2626 length:846 start_codon:yes stop_codon:yes gene_type:complete